MLRESLLLDQWRLGRGHGDSSQDEAECETHVVGWTVQLEVPFSGV
jgi:hypothetical protein